jgi:PAS domain S-box-containing protein
MTDKLTPEELRAENTKLREQLAEAQETLRAITSAEVDALVVNTLQGEQVFTLQGADVVYRVAIENINEGAITLSAEGIILYSNGHFSRMTGNDLHKVIGTSLFDYVDPAGHEVLRNLIGQEQGRREISFRCADGNQLPAYISIQKLHFESQVTICAAITDLTELKAAEADLKKFRDHLKELVIVRTADLEAANQELVSFSYSVSHDLRAPLRGIEGFSLSLMEDYGDKLDEQGKEYLQNIRSSSRLMSKLIDDILTISRITCAKLDALPLDMSTLAEEVEAELRRTQSDRQVEFRIRPHLEVMGDRNLLKLVLQNLLGNAFKFTAKTTNPVIEFGMQEQGGQKVYFVKDNGVGFDMAYVDKLFKPFQRLHTNQEFPGTGIGLASVQRIVNRHGGKAWAEGGVGKGATFYFTLEK